MNANMIVANNMIKFETVTCTTPSAQSSEWANLLVGAAQCMGVVAPYYHPLDMEDLPY